MVRSIKEYNNGNDKTFHREKDYFSFIIINRNIDGVRRWGQETHKHR